MSLPSNREKKQNLMMKLREKIPDQIKRKIETFKKFFEVLSLMFLEA